MGFLPKAIPVLLVVIVVSMAGCGSGDGGDSTSSTAGSATASGSSAARNASPAAVAIVDYTYKPAQITVPAGTTVEFTNQDSTPHTATSKQSGAFETGSIDSGKTGTVTLEKAGTYAYFCAFHPFMKGTITVE